MFAVKTSIAHEKSVAEMVYHKLDLREPKPDVKSILVLDQLRGYIFLEAPHQRDVMIATANVAHVKGKTIGQIKLEELNHFLIPESITETLEIGDKVEIISGLFSGERAYVSQIDAAKDEVTLSLTGSDNPIPIKLHVDYLKVIEKGIPRDTYLEGEEAQVVGRGIKEYSFGDESEEKAEPGIFGDDDVATTADVEASAETTEEVPEVAVFSGKKQKVVGELFDLNVDDFDDEFEEEFEYEADSDLDIGFTDDDLGIDEGEPDKEKKVDEETSEDIDDDWM